MNGLQVYLASSSPRRRELLAQVGIAYEVVKSNYQEDNRIGEEPVHLVERQAAGKAKAAVADSDSRPVIGADTVVVFNGQVLGKPQTVEEAKRMLRSLSGCTHSVITGVCIRYKNTEIVFHCETEVTFYKLSDELIEAYVATGEPMDKAGAYGIQGKGAVLVERIKGSYTNVVGLPVEAVCRRLWELR